MKPKYFTYEEELAQQKRNIPEAFRKDLNEHPTYEEVLAQQKRNNPEAFQKTEKS